MNTDPKLEAYVISIVAVVLEKDITQVSRETELHLKHIEEIEKRLTGYYIRPEVLHGKIHNLGHLIDALISKEEQRREKKAIQATAEVLNLEPKQVTRETELELKDIDKLLNKLDDYALKPEVRRGDIFNVGYLINSLEEL